MGLNRDHWLTKTLAALSSRGGTVAFRRLLYEVDDFEISSSVKGSAS